MYEIRKILLANSDELCSTRGQLRAALLGAQLKLDSFDMLTVKRNVRLFRGAASRYSHIEVSGETLSTSHAGKRQSVSLHAGADALSSLWQDVPGTAVELIVERARSEGADLTLLAPQRRNAFLEMLSPSLSREILSRSRNSVLLVHKEPREAYRKVLVAVDFSPECYVAARVALALALAPGAQFTFVHAYHHPEASLMREFELPPAIIRSYQARGSEEAGMQLNRWINDLGVPQPGTGAAHVGFPVPVIKAKALQIGADLLVMGRQGLTRDAREGLGGVARRFVNRSPCDVLIGPALTGLPSAREAASRLAPHAFAAEFCAQTSTRGNER